MTNEISQTDDIVQSEIETVQSSDFAVELPVNTASDDGGERDKLAIPKTALLNVSVQVMVSVGFATVKIGELAALSRDALLNLNTKVDDPVQIMINGKIIAFGILEENTDTGRLQVRVSKITDNNLTE